MTNDSTVIELPTDTAQSLVVAIVATSGYAPDPLSIVRADDLLRAQSCEVRHYDDPSTRYLRFAAPDDQRLLGLHAAARDPEVDIVIALRGGYGISRLLPYIDFSLLVNSGKKFVGHSDFTALQMGMLAHGGYSFCGPMICDDFARENPSDFTITQFWNCLRGPQHVIPIATKEQSVNFSGKTVEGIEGMLWGGNLSMLVHLIGSPWFPAVSDGILFLEDINEHPFRIERMMLQLMHAGVLQKQRAIVLGDFSGGAVSGYDNGYDSTAMLSYLRGCIDIPILSGLPFGHVPDKTTLPVGAHAQLQFIEGDLQLTVKDYPHLKRLI
jgi:muramoyltetrapeptide carboxypeptidase